MSIQNDEQLEAFLERVLRLSSERGRALSEDEVHEIGLDIGLSEADLAAARQEGLEHLERARNFRGYDRLDDAIAEFDEAIVLLPAHMQARSELAHTLFERFQKSGDRVDLDRAETLARQLLDIDPGFTAGYELLNAIDEAESRDATPLKWAVIGSMTALVAILGVVGLVLSSSDEDQGTASQEASSPEVAPPEAPEESASSGTKKTHDQGAHELPIEIVDKANSGLTLEVRASKLDVYQDRAFYNFRGFLKAPERHEYEKVDASLQLLDADSNLVAKLPGRVILQSHHPTLRPGQTHPFHLLKEADSGVERATLTIESVDDYPSIGEYPPTRPVEASFEEGTPPGFELSFGLRQMSDKKSALAEGMRHFRGSFEVTNDGGRAVKLLKVRARFYDADGELLEIEKLFNKEDLTSQEAYVVSSSAPALLPGETRAFALLATVPDAFERYELSVSELE